MSNARLGKGLFTRRYDSDYNLRAAQAAGLELESDGNKWLRLIQNAKSEKRRII